MLSNSDWMFVLLGCLVSFLLPLLLPPIINILAYFLFPLGPKTNQRT